MPGISKNASGPVGDRINTCAPSFIISSLCLRRPEKWTGIAEECGSPTPTPWNQPKVVFLLTYLKHKYAWWDSNVWQTKKNPHDCFYWENEVQSQVESYQRLKKYRSRVSVTKEPSDRFWLRSVDLFQILFTIIKLYQLIFILSQR